ncbi:hypothetical protein [Ruminococcus sp.]|uniref:hypothetical protein n=1 Tax=Ruminococcus sp. TaxID=41978 RepID=UPI00258A6989|nr:hypothetical protein [Ruminococcus sp.]MCR5020528.1 hypothetical protein [Ruminococcus sp.]
MTVEKSGRYELSISDSPFIRAYPEFLFIDSIIGQENLIEDEIAVVSVDGFKDSKWTFTFSNASYYVDSAVHFYKRGFDIESVKAFYRPLNYHSDEVIFHIQKLQYTNHWDSINFFIEQHEPLEMLNDFEHMDLVLGRHCSGELFLIDHNVKHWFGLPDGNVCDTFRISVSDGHVHVEAFAGGSYIPLYTSEQRLPESDETAYIGCMSCQEDNQYNKWLVQNFIQLKFNVEHDPYMNYSGFIRQNSKTYGVNPFIRFQYETSETIDTWYGSLRKFLIDRLKHSVYVQLDLNELFLPGSRYYEQECHVHENMVYGFDEDRQTFLLINIFNGKPKKLEVSFETLENAWVRTEAIGFCFSPDHNPYELDISHVYTEICDYLSGRNTTEDHAHLAEVDHGIFGYAIYNELLHDPDAFQAFLRDIRVSYLLFEHKKCMRHRFTYFYEMGMIAEYDYSILKQEINSVCDISQKLMLLALKNSLSPNAHSYDSMREMLAVLRDIELRCYTRFLNIMEVL